MSYKYQSGYIKLGYKKKNLKAFEGLFNEIDNHIDHLTERNFLGFYFSINIISIISLIPIYLNFRYLIKNKSTITPINHNQLLKIIYFSFFLFHQCKIIINLL